MPKIVLNLSDAQYNALLRRMVEDGKRSPEAYVLAAVLPKPQTRKKKVVPIEQAAGHAG